MSDNDNISSEFVIETLDGYGRVMVASRDILPWELVLEDTCLVMAPNDVPVCLGCLGQLSAETVVLCEGCGWPICSASCAKREEHRRECKLFSQQGVTPTLRNFSEQNWMYLAVGILRTLFLKQDNKKLWQHVENLMDHWEERSKDKSVVTGLIIIFQFFNKKLKLDWITQEDVNHVFGVLQTNSLSLISLNGRACYPLVSVLSHSCVPNLEPVSNPSSQIKFRAKRHIKKGEQLTIRYTTFTRSQWSIQEELRREWMFECACERCADPLKSDVGTFTSFLKCKCGGFYNQKKKNTFSFQCNKCTSNEDFTESYTRFSEIENELLNSHADIESLCIEMEKDERIHDMFYLKSKVFMTFIEAYCDSKDPVDVDKVVFRTKIVLQLIRELDPGSSKVTGKFLLILANAQEKQLSIRKQNDGDFSVKELRKAVADVVKTKMIANKMLGCGFKR